MAPNAVDAMQGSATPYSQHPPFMGAPPSREHLPSRVCSARVSLPRESRIIIISAVVGSGAEPLPLLCTCLVEVSVAVGIWYSTVTRVCE
jgi:hypothetical protein